MRTGYCPACGHAHFQIRVTGDRFGLVCARCDKTWASEVASDWPYAEGQEAVAQGGGEPQDMVSPPQGEDNWNPAITMPFRRTVLIKTVTGLMRLARRNWYEPNRQGNIHCWRQDTSGDLVATHWKDIDEPEGKWRAKQKKGET